MILKIRQAKLVDNVLVWSVIEEELDPNLESDKIESNTNEKMIVKNPETAQTRLKTQQIDNSQIVESPNSINDWKLLESLRKMETEEQTLLRTKTKLGRNSARPAQQNRQRN